MQKRGKAMADLIALWHAEHRYFGRLLNLLQKQIEVFHSGGQPNYELMLDIISYLRDYTDKVHHPREDVAFAQLAKHRPDLDLVLERLKQEHRVIANSGENLRQLLQAVVDGALAPRAEIEAAAATYLVYYNHHIAKEEADILSRAEFSLTDKDWEEVARAVPTVNDPLGDASAAQHFRELRRQLALAA
jgi:hemerythrin-like domain-containing protein